MSSTVNNFFESIVNSTNPQYIGAPSQPVWIAPSNMEGINQSLPLNIIQSNGQYNTSFMGESLFK